MGGGGQQVVVVVVGLQPRKVMLKTHIQALIAYTHLRCNQNNALL